MESLDEPPRTGNVDFLDLIPCLGLCCCFLSCYTEMPDCLGTVCESTLCCVNVRSLLCKTGKEEEIYCKCISCEIDVIPCSVCVKSRSQVCCLDLRAAFPPKDDFPCILNLLCCTVTHSLSFFSLHRSLNIFFLALFSSSAAMNTLPPVNSERISVKSKELSVKTLLLSPSGSSARTLTLSECKLLRRLPKVPQPMR